LVHFVVCCTEKNLATPALSASRNREISWTQKYFASLAKIVPRSVPRFRNLFNRAKNMKLTLGKLHCSKLE
jgi:hypothetical protein